MRKFFFWVVTLMLLSAVSFWAYSTFAPVRVYAPGPEDGAPATVEPAAAQQAAFPAPVDVAPALPTDPAATAPDQPVPYDQLKEGETPAPPPDAKSDDKAIFY